MMRGGDLFRLQKILGHKSSEITMRYAHLAPDAFRQDHDRFGTGWDVEQRGQLLKLGQGR